MGRSERFAAVVLVSFSGLFPLTAQIVGRGGVVGGVTGSATGALGTGVGAPAGSVAGVAQGEVGTAANARAIGQTSDVGATMRQNAALSSSVQPLLPGSMDMGSASAGFRDTAQFVTTLHTARNLNIPFGDLKARTTGKGHVSLDEAVRKLRPDLDDKAVKSSVNLAGKESDHDLAQASTPVSEDRVAARVASDASLSSRMKAILPADTDVKTAAAGFRNKDQFTATAEAAHDHQLSFTDLKSRVTAGQSLNQAVQEMQANAGNHSRVSASTSASTSASASASAVHASASGSVDASAQAGKRK